MSFDFPASPTTGTLYQPAGGPTYRWSGSVWAVVAAQFQGAMASDTAPSNPVPGQLWWESDSGALFYYFDDGNSQQWVQITGATQPIGSVVDSVIGTYAVSADITAVIPYDDTIPQIGEGTQIISVTITPKSITNKLRCRFRTQAGANAATAVSAALFLGSGANALAAVGTSITATGFSFNMMFEHEFVPGATTAQTLTVRVGPAASICRLNGTVSGRVFGGVNVTTLVVEEVVA